jgi:hypothetical protein
MSVRETSNTRLDMRGWLKPIEVQVVLALFIAIGGFAALAHVAFMGFMIFAASEVLDDICGKKRPASQEPEYSRPPAKDLELEANGHTVLFNRLMR